jgi:hypothetical protein
VSATPGATDVTVVLDTRTSVRIRVEGFASGVKTKFTVVTRDPTTSATIPHGGLLDGDGVLRFAGIDPASRHHLLVGPTADGLLALSGDLVPGGEEVVLRAQRGDPLGGRVVLPAGVTASEVGIVVFGDLWTAHAQVDGEGRFRFAGLPPGQCLVGAAVVRAGKALFGGNATATTGQDVVIELRPVATSGR